MKNYIYNCKNYRKEKRKIGIKRFFTWTIMLWFIFSTVGAVNTYLALVGDITHIDHSEPLVAPANAEFVPSSSEDIIRYVAEKKDFKDVQLLLDIAFCESSLNYRAYNINKNGSSDMGLFQFNTIHNFGEKPLDPYWATEKAIEWIRAGKISAWYSSAKCWQNK